MAGCYGHDRNVIRDDSAKLNRTPVRFFLTALRTPRYGHEHSTSL